MSGKRCGDTNGIPHIKITALAAPKDYCNSDTRQMVMASSPTLRDIESDGRSGIR